MTMDREATVAISPAAERMRRCRQRRRDGVRVVSLELVQDEIDALVARGLLKEEDIDDRFAILEAVYSFFGQTLVRDAQRDGPDTSTEGQSAIHTTGGYP
jgi:hypothetical protein